MPNPSFLGTMTLALGAIVGLFFIDTSLATVERSQSRADAERSYNNGLRLMREGHSDAAVEQFGDALANSRDNEIYLLALGQAQAGAGHFAEAEQTLHDLLERNGLGGPANLAMARVLVKEKSMNQAFSYYHRAIYGQWNESAREKQLAVRFELAELLASQKGREGLLAELLPLQEEAPDDPATRMQLGQLFVSANAPARAAIIFRDLLRVQPHNADAWDALGDTEFVRGNYRAALADFDNALRWRPEDGHARQRAAVGRDILALDPTARGLGQAEQLRRSANLLKMTTDQVRSCAPADLTAQADAMAKKRRSDFDANLELADKLWQAGGACESSAPESLSLMLTRLAP